MQVPMKGTLGAGLAVLLSSSLAVGQTLVSDAPAEEPGPKEEQAPKEKSAENEEPIPSSPLRPKADAPVGAPPAGAATGGSQDSRPPPSEPTEPAPPAPSATDAAPIGEGSASQAPRVTEEPKETVTEVRVIGSKPDGMRRLPGSGTLVTEREIQRAEPYDVAEMLRRVPGVQARQDFGAGMRLDISIRGLEAGRSRRVLILEDGVPQGNNPYGEPDLYAQPAIERMRGMEVVKGSGSILFGPQTTGGVINFLTKIPPPHRRTLVDVEGGDRNYVRGIASYGDTFGSARYITQASYKQGSGIRERPFIRRTPLPSSPWIPRLKGN